MQIRQTTYSRILFLIVLVAVFIHAQDIERLILVDGRVLVGNYDEPGQRIEITTGTIKAWIPIPPQQITKRELAVPPVPPPTEHDLRAVEDRVTLERAALAAKRVEEVAQRPISEAAQKKSQADNAEQDRLALAKAANQQRADDLDRQAQARFYNETAKADRIEAEKIRQQRLDQEKYDLAIKADEARRKAEEDRIEKVEQKRRNDYLEQSGRESRNRIFLVALIVGVIAFGINALPTVIALLRKHRFRLQIFLINLIGTFPIFLNGISPDNKLNGSILFGLTFISWTGALVWSTWPGLNQVPPAEPVAVRRLRRSSIPYVDKTAEKAPPTSL